MRTCSVGPTGTRSATAMPEVDGLVTVSTHAPSSSARIRPGELTAGQRLEHSLDRASLWKHERSTKMPVIDGLVMRRPNLIEAVRRLGLVGPDTPVFDAADDPQL